MLKKIILFVSSFVLVIILNSCIFDLISGGNKVDILIPEKSNLINLKVGDEFEIPFKIANEQPDQKIIIKSSDPSVIEIISSKIGLIKALKKGNVDLSIFYGNKFKKINITVE